MNRVIKLLKILSNVSFARALLKGSPASVEHEAVLKSVHPIFIVDVGANRGQFAVACREYMPSATIHSIEPLNEPAQIARQIMGSDSKFFLHTCAIGAEHQTGVMHVSKRDYSSSLLPMGEELLNLFPSTAERGVRDVPVFPLNEVVEPHLIQSPALLKIDVQGYELDVLRGCSEMLNKFDYIYVECSITELYVGQALAQDVIMFLGQAGFQLNGIHDVYYDRTGKAIQADFLFLKKV